MDGHVHVTRGIVAGGVVQRALRAADRDEALLALRDPYEVGPLDDLDRGGDGRIAFWTAVGLAEPETTLEADAWAAIGGAASLTVWHGPHPGERLMWLRVAAVRHGSGQPLLEVPCEPAIDDGRQPSLVGQPLDLARALRTRRRPADLSALAAEWDRVSREPNVMFRRTIDGRIAGLPIDGYDADILMHCRRRFTSLPRVIGRIVTTFPVGDGVIGWRIRTLVREGVLEGRGTGTYGPRAGEHADGATPGLPVDGVSSRIAFGRPRRNDVDRKLGCCSREQARAPPPSPRPECGRARGRGPHRRCRGRGS
jgi:hypothetical protein